MPIQRPRSVALLGACLLAPLLALAPPAGAAGARSTDDACPPGQVPEDLFRDVPAADAHEPSIDCLRWWLVFVGQSTAAYDPQSPMTRGQMSTVIARLIDRSGRPTDPSAPDAFADDDQHAHEGSINELAEAGVVQGVSPGVFAPDAPVTRAQMATFLVRAYERSSGRRLESAGDAFRDDDGSTHEASIDRAAAAGFTAGVAGGGYAPEQHVRRGPMASFTARILDLLVEQDGVVVPSARAGQLDASFGEQGVQKVAPRPAGSSNTATDMALDADGRIVLVGDDFSVVRLLPEGRRDPEFGERGQARGAFGPDSRAVGVVVQPDGRLVVAGAQPRQDGGVDVALARYLPDGGLDPSFGEDGRVTSALPAGSDVVAVALQADGRIVVAGHAAGAGGTDLVLLRFLGDGALDEGFADEGTARTDVRGTADRAGALLVQPDGAVVIGGAADETEPDTDDRADWVLVRHLPDGSRDAGFGEAGLVITDAGLGTDQLTALALQDEGRLVAVGSIGSGPYPRPNGLPPGDGSGGALARYLPDGRLDADVPNGGIVQLHYFQDTRFSDVVVQPDRQLLLVGHAQEAWLVVRLEEDAGQDDPAFSGAVSPVGSVANAAVLRPDGRLLVAGCDCSSPEFRSDPADVSSAMAVLSYHTASG